MISVANYLNEYYDTFQDFQEEVETGELWISLFDDVDVENPSKAFDNIYSEIKQANIKCRKTSEIDGGYRVRMLIVTEPQKLLGLFKK